jgi:hypothetical protein
MVQFVEPYIEPDQSFLLDELLENGEMEAKFYDGPNVFSFVPSGEVVKVKRVVTSLLPGDVPIVKCVGSNYIKHSMLTLRIYLKLIADLFVVQEGRRKPPPYPSGHPDSQPRPRGSTRLRRGAQHCDWYNGKRHSQLRGS